VGPPRNWFTSGSSTINEAEQQVSGLTDYLYHVDVRGKDSAWVVGDNGVILRTTNAGISWERVAVDTKETLVNIAFANNKQGWITGWNGTILRTSDGGKSWLEQESGTKVNLYGLSIAKKQVWAVGADGLVLKYNAN
jgi:photosystem II stability/assembly factor-like uncharacterized protein